MKIAHDFIDDLRIVGPLLSHNQWRRPSPCTLALADLDALDAHLSTAQAAVRTRSERALQAHLTQVPDSPLLSRISLFKTIGMCRQEVVHTNALAWLLDPTQPHGFNRSLFQAFLRAVILGGGNDEKACEHLTRPNTVITRVAPEFLLSSACRIDVLAQGVLADGQPWALLIEAKVGAEERPDQLVDYDIALDAYLGERSQDTLVLRVFLSEDGRIGKTAASGTAWTSLTYRAMAREFLTIYPSLSDREGYPFLRLYLAGLLDDVCGIACTDSLDALLRLNAHTDLENLLEARHV